MNDAEANLQMQLHLAVTCLATAAITIVVVTCLHDCGAYSMHFKWAYVHQNGRSSCCLQSSCSRLHGVRCRSNLSRFRNHHVSSIRTTSSTLFTNSNESAERDRIRRRRRRNLESKTIVPSMEHPTQLSHPLLRPLPMMPSAPSLEPSAVCNARIRMWRAMPCINRC